MKSSLILLGICVLAGRAQAQSSLWTDPRGLPSGVAWVQQIDEKTSATWRTYKGGPMGEVVSFNPQTSEVKYNPTNGIYEAVIREDLKDGKWTLDREAEEKQRQEKESEQQDSVWPKEPEPITLSSDSKELAKNANGEYEAVASEDALSGEAWKERVSGGESSRESPKIVEDLAPQGQPKVNANSVVGLWDTKYPGIIAGSYFIYSDGRYIYSAGAPGTWTQSNSKVTFTQDTNGAVYTAIVDGDTLVRDDGNVWERSH